MKAEFRALSTLTPQGLWVQRPEEGIPHASASSPWDTGLLTSTSKISGKARKQNCRPEEPKSKHFAASSPLPSYNFFVNTLTPTAATPS